MTAHLVLKYARLDEVVAAGGDAVAVGESSVPLQLGERQTVHALLAALIVHSANDASIVLAHATMDQPAAQAAVGAGGEAARPAAAGRSGRALRPAHERRGAQARPARHGLPHAARARRARRALLGARRARARARSTWPRRSSARSPRRRTVTIPGHRLQTSNTLLAVYAGLDGVKTGHTDEAGWNLAASADRGGMRMYAILLGAPDEASRDRDIARLMDWGFDRYKRARLVRAGQSFGHAGTCASSRRRGSRSTLDPGERVRERIVLPRRLDRAVSAGERARLRRAAQRARRARPRAAGRRQRRRRPAGARAVAALAPARTSETVATFKGRRRACRRERG